MKIHLCLLSLGASAALFTLSACQTQEPAAETTPVEVDRPSGEAFGTLSAPDPRPATEAEAAGLEAARKAFQAPGITRESPVPLSKTAAALPTCKVTFSSISGLGAISDKAYSSYVINEYYANTCNSTYKMNFGSWDGDRFRLIPEATGWCKGDPYRIGTWMNGFCQMQTDAAYVPRMAGNAGGKSALFIFPVDQSGKPKDFHLQAIRVRSGSLKITAYLVGTGEVVYGPFNSPNRWTFPSNTRIAYMQVYQYARNGSIIFDDLEVSIIP